MYEFIGLNKYNEQVKCLILAEFIYNDKKFVYYKDNDNNVYTAILDGTDLKQIIKKSELEVVNKVYKALKGKPDFINFGNIFYNSIEYKSIYDQNSKTRYFFNNINGKLKEVEGEIKKYFDDNFNKEIDIMYSGNDNSKYKNTKNMIIKIGEITIVLLITANLLITPLQTINLNEGFIQNISAIMEVYDVDKASVKTILSYIENNMRIDEKDKEFLTGMEHFFTENLDYFDMSTLKKNLMNLRIVYEKDNQEAHRISNRVKGFYRLIDDKITIFYSDSMNEDIITKKVVFHEFMHATSNNGYVANGTIGLNLTEGINEQMATEYLKTYSDTYNKAQTYARIMCELVGPDKVKESFFKHDIEILVDALQQICGSKKDAKRFISLIDDDGRMTTKILLNNSENEVKDAKLTLEKLEPMIDDYIKLYYENKFNNRIEEDKLMLACLDSLRLTNNLNNEFYKENNMDKINVVKNYFNKSLENESVIIEYIYKSSETKQIKNYNIQRLENGQYRRTFSNGDYRDYEKDPSLVSYDKANYAFEEKDRIGKII
ncbi:MAG: hypothetical protein RRY22_05105 [Bacilli bacterium]